MCSHNLLFVPPKRSLFTAIVALALLPWLPARAAEPQPGLWEIHRTIEGGGTSTVRPTRTRCVTAAQVSQFAQMASHEVTVGPATCQNLDLHQTETGMTWTTQCPTLPVRIAASYVVDSPQHYIWTFRRDIIVAGHVLATSTVTIDGRRIGECPK